MVKYFLSFSSFGLLQLGEKRQIGGLTGFLRGPVRDFVLSSQEEKGLLTRRRLAKSDCQFGFWPTRVGVGRGSVVLPHELETSCVTSHRGRGPSTSHARV